MLSHALVLYPTLRPNAQWLGPVVTRFATERNEVWLTLDDGPAADTGEILHLLEEYGVRATFFVKGSLVDRDPSRLRAIVEAGHSVGNHTYGHPSATFWCLLPRTIAREIDRCSGAIARVAGSSPRWFRAPVGMKNPAVHPLLAERDLRLIGWSSRAFDSVEKNPARAAARIIKDLRPGSILLLHQGRPHSVDVVERVIREVRERGYSFVIPTDIQLRPS